MNPAPHDYRVVPSEDSVEAMEHDAWFREHAGPGEVAQRDRRVEQAERDASDAYDAGDMDRLGISIALREHAFWALPTADHVDAGHFDEATYHAAAADEDADDDADGWY